MYISDSIEQLLPRGFFENKPPGAGLQTRLLGPLEAGENNNAGVRKLDQDRLDRRKHVLARIDVVVAVLGHQQLDANPEQQQAADDLEPRQRQQRYREHRQHYPQHDRRARTPENRLLLLPGRQRTGGQRNDYRVVTGKNDVDADNFEI